MLADGAGSKKRSRDGARVACNVTKAILESGKSNVLSDPLETGAQILRTVRSKLEQLAVDAGEPFEQFGSTLLYTALYRESNFWYAFAGQLGDGVVVLSDSSEARILFQQTRGEFINETVFTTNRSPESYLQVDLRFASEPLGFLLASDGVAPNIVDTHSQCVAKACTTVLSWAATERQDVIQRAIQKNLEGVFRDNAIDDYGKSIVHVRTSHVPRFEVEIGGENRLFDKMGTEYDHFANLPEGEKMEIIRAYARGRLKEGERLWWIENPSEASHSLPLQARLYMSLDQEEKRSLRAEAALLCPKIVASSRTRGKYNDATLYLLTYHGVLAPQIRDLFSAGSVALRTDPTRGGDLYIKRSLEDIQEEMKAAAIRLPSELFEEYWGYDVDPPARIREWLKHADQHADGWKPSDSLFLDHTS